MMYDFMYEENAFAPENARTFDVIIIELIELFYNIGDTDMERYVQTYDFCVSQYNYSYIDGPSDVTFDELEYAQATICETLEYYGLTEEARELEEIGFEF